MRIYYLLGFLPLFDLNVNLDEERIQQTPYIESSLNLYKVEVCFLNNHLMMFQYTNYL